MENKKFSKSIILVFVISLLNLSAFLASGVAYDSVVTLLVSTVIMAAFCYWILYLKKRAIKNNLEGIKMANFSFYTTVVVILLEVIGALILMVYTNNLKTFAVDKTQYFFDNNFIVLKENSTERLQRVLSYEKEMADINKKFAEVGKINECVQEEDDFIGTAFGPYMNFDKLAIGLRGEFSVRCYGEEKPFDFMAMTKYKNKNWLIDQYNFDADIGKNFDIQDNNNSSSND